MEIHFEGTISLCGYGDPLLHNDISYIVKKLSNVSRVELEVTSDTIADGDKFGEQLQATELLFILKLKKQFMFSMLIVEMKLIKLPV